MTHPSDRPTGDAERSVPEHPGTHAAVGGPPPVPDAAAAQPDPPAEQPADASAPPPDGEPGGGATAPAGVSVLATVAIALIAGLVGLTIGAGLGGGDATPPAAVSTMDVEARPALGPPDAPVTIELYSDFGCPYCQRHDRDVEPELIDRYVATGQARIEWYDVPFQGAASVDLAIAARAAERQGRFWEFKDAVFETDGRDASAERLREFATAAGLDVAAFERDLTDPSLELAVRRDLDHAQSIGVRATPAFLIEGEPLIGAQPIDAFVPVIERALDGR